MPLILQELQKNWTVLAQAPWSFATLCVAVFVLAWGIVNWYHQREKNGLREQLNALREQVKVREAQLADRDRLVRDLRPTQTSYSLLSNEVLRERAFDLATRLRTFFRDEREKEREIEEWDREQREHWGDLNGTAYLRMAEAKRQQRTDERKDVYNCSHKSEAVLLRNEILLRLPDLPKGGIWGPGGE